jgi:hypothetical protein
LADIFLSYGGAEFLVEAFEKSLERQRHTVYSDSDFEFKSAAILVRSHSLTRSSLFGAHSP